MKWLKTTVGYESNDPETAAALICEIFQGFGLTGVIVESPETDDTAEDTGFDASRAGDAAESFGHHAVTGFFPERYHGENHRKTFETQLCRLIPEIIATCRVRYSDIDDTDWAEFWKLHFHPVKVTDRIVIRPSWQPYEAKQNEIIIDLDPGMAFGTGTHPTTALSIRLIQKYLSCGMSFLDIGMGSGILMIAAAKLGAESAAGIDCDPVAVEVAKQNLCRNRISADNFSPKQGDLVFSVNKKFDMIAANIVSETICRLIPDVYPLLPCGGIFIASGITVEKENMVIEKLGGCGFDVLEKKHLENWSAVAAKKKVLQAKPDQ